MRTLTLTLALIALGACKPGDLAANKSAENEVRDDVVNLCLDSLLSDKFPELKCYGPASVDGGSTEMALCTFGINDLDDTTRSEEVREVILAATGKFENGLGTVQDRVYVHFTSGTPAGIDDITPILPLYNEANDEMKGIIINIVDNTRVGFNHACSMPGSN